MTQHASNTPRPPAGEGAGERVEGSDLDILFPNRQITVGGKTLTVPEYSFKESLEHSDRFQVLIDAVRALMQGGEPPELSHVLAEMATCHKDLIALVALATDTDAAFIERLNPQEGQQLLLLWWVLNSPFLLGSAVLFAKAALAAKAKAPVSVRSSPN